MAAPEPQPSWTVDDVAVFLRIPKETLYTWRKRQYGPPAARVGRHLRYDQADVYAWFSSQKGQVA